MAVLETGDLTIPTQILDPWLKNVSDGAVVPQLSGATPMKFGAGEAFIFDIGEAEYVGEGSQKGPSTITSRTQDRKSTRLNSSHVAISYAVFCLKKKNKRQK